MREDKAAAIAYNEGDRAPKVLSRGKGHAAEVLKKIAMEHSIPIIESPELTESLMELKPFDDIPDEYWVLVAEILKFVYQTRETGANLS